MRCRRVSDWLKGRRVESDLLRARSEGGGGEERVESNWIRKRRLEFVQLKDRRVFNWLRCRRIESDWLRGGQNEVSAVSFTLYFISPLSLGPGMGRWRLIPPGRWGNGDRYVWRKGWGWVTLGKGQGRYFVPCCSSCHLQSDWITRILSRQERSEANSPPTEGEVLDPLSFPHSLAAPLVLGKHAVHLSSF